MNGFALVPIISLLGWLVLALGAYRAHRIGAKQTLVLAMVWGAIFFLVAAVFSAVSA